MANALAHVTTASPDHSLFRRLADGVLRVPLAGKLAGANLALIGLVAWAVAPAGQGVSERVIAICVASVAVNVALVLAALRPLRELEVTAARVAEGDFDARVPASPVADRDVARVGATFNTLVDGLVAERARLRRLAHEVISAGEHERAQLGHALHDSAAQSLASLAWQASSMLQDDATSATMRERLVTISDVAATVLEEVRSLAQNTYPRALDDLGLVAALRALAHVRGARDGVDVRVETADGSHRIPVDARRALYRIAEEAIENAVRHGGARRITVTVGTSPSGAWLVVHDDGKGFDVSAEERNPRGTGLFTMRERLALVSGTLSVGSAPDGTTIEAMIPFREGGESNGR